MFVCTCFPSIYYLTHRSEAPATVQAHPGVLVVVEAATRTTCTSHAPTQSPASTERTRRGPWRTTRGPGVTRSPGAAGSLATGAPSTRADEAVPGAAEAAAGRPTGTAAPGAGRGPTPGHDTPRTEECSGRTPGVPCHPGDDTSATGTTPYLDAAWVSLVYPFAQPSSSCIIYSPSMGLLRELWLSLMLRYFF